MTTTVENVVQISARRYSRLSGGICDPDDLAQTAWAEVARISPKRDASRTDEEWVSYVRTTVEGVLRRATMKSRRFASVETCCDDLESAYPANPGETTVDVEDTCDRARMYRKVMDAIRRRGETALIPVLRGEVSKSEIAEQLGLSPTRISQKLAALKEDVRRKIDAEDSQISMGW